MRTVKWSWTDRRGETIVKIGFVDYYLDEWHANNYPALIKEVSGGEMEVAYAYGHIDSPIGGMTTDEWCVKYGIERVATIEELTAKSDAVIVLSPDNCEMHEELCQIPLRSGKRCYVDKTFAPDYPTARRIFDIAEQSGTPCYSTSALRFADEYKDIDSASITSLCSWGPNDFDTYSIHQLEPIMMLIKSHPVRVMYLPGENWYTVVIAFEDGRTATLTGYAKGSPFMMNIAGKAENTLVKVESDFFHNFIVELVAFLRTGEIHVPHDQTLAIMAVRGAGLEAIQKPGVWVDVPAIS